MRFKSDKQRRFVMSMFSSKPSLATVSFDFDGVLAKKVDDVSNIGKPIKPMVNLAKDLHNKGHVLFINSARLNPRPFADNDKIDKDVADGTAKNKVEKFLDENGLGDCFDYVGCEKKIADVYIDDLAVRYDGNDDEIKDAVFGVGDKYSAATDMVEKHKNFVSTKEYPFPSLFGDDNDDLAAVIAGSKPAAMVTPSGKVGKELLDMAAKKGLSVKKIIDMEPGGGIVFGFSYIVGKPENVKIISEMKKKADADPDIGDNMDYHLNMGAALGYNPKAIDDFLYAIKHDIPYAYALSNNKMMTDDQRRIDEI